MFFSIGPAVLGRSLIADLSFRCPARCLVPPVSSRTAQLALPRRRSKGDRCADR